MGEVRDATRDKPAHTPHPAKFSDPIMVEIERVLEERVEHGAAILDPFAGVGTIHDLSDRWDTYAVEIEPEWAMQAAERGTTWCGNFFDLPTADVAGVYRYFDAVVTSPAYGNRMADNHQPGPEDTSTRITYRHKLGRPLTPGNSGGMQWSAKPGNEYRMFHRRAWRQVAQMLVPGGVFVLNVKDHVRKGEPQGVPEWHRRIVEARGFECVETVKVPTRGMGFGANQYDGKSKIDHEIVYVFERTTEEV